MIWLFFILLLFLTLLYLGAPLLAKSAPPVKHGSEVQDYLSEIDKIEQQLETAKKTDEKDRLQMTKLELERQVLRATARGRGSSSGTFILSALVLFLGFGGLGLYQILGRADLTATPKPMASRETTRAPRDKRIQLEALVDKLAAKLKTDGFKNDPLGWRLYAHSLVSLERYDEALKAYERLLQLNGEDQEIRKEYEQLRVFLANNKNNISGPSREQIEAASRMTASERAAMINSMVDGLSEKMKSDPQNIDGWIRLLSARKKLNQSEKAKAEIARMKTALKDKPDTIAMILQKTGWQATP